MIAGLRTSRTSRCGRSKCFHPSTRSSKCWEKRSPCWPLLHSFRPISWRRLARSGVSIGTAVSTTEGREFALRGAPLAACEPGIRGLARPQPTDDFRSQQHDGGPDNCDPRRGSRRDDQDRPRVRAIFSSLSSIRRLRNCAVRIVEGYGERSSCLFKRQTRPSSNSRGVHSLRRRRHSHVSIGEGGATVPARLRLELARARGNPWTNASRGDDDDKIGTRARCSKLERSDRGGLSERRPVARCARDEDDAGRGRHCRSRAENVLRPAQHAQAFDDEDPSTADQLCAVLEGRRRRTFPRPGGGWLHRYRELLVDSRGRPPKRTSTEKQKTPLFSDYVALVVELRRKKRSPRKLDLPDQVVALMLGVPPSRTATRGVADRQH